MSTVDDTTKPIVTLRPYQIEAIRQVQEHIAAGKKKVLLVAPTGSGKCLTPETFVWNKGLTTLRALWGSTSILTPVGRKEISGWYDDGRRDGVEIMLRCGLSIDSTLNHRVWIRTDDGYEGWRQAGELTTDDYVAVARGQADFGDKEIPLDEAYALGLLIADGCINPHDSRLRIDKQRPVVEHIRPVVERWHQKVGTGKIASTIQDWSDYHTIIFSNGHFKPFFSSEYGIDWEYSESRSVPRCILQGTRPVVQHFLKGYFDGDGYCDKQAAVSTASPLLCAQIHQLLLGLGIFARRRLKQTSGLPAHIVEVYDTEEFAKQIGFTPYGLIKDRNFARLLSKTRNTNVDLIPGLGNIIRAATRNIPGHTLRKDLWHHVAAYYDSKNRRPSYAALQKWVNDLPASPERLEMARILNQHYAWSKVTEIKPSFRHRVDCEVPEVHAFIGNGLVNHNTMIAGAMVEQFTAKGQRTLFMAHRRELILQAYHRFQDFGLTEDRIGIIMADHPFYRPGAPVQIASIDTLRNRAKPLADYVFIDEAHRALAQTYIDITEHYENAIHLGLTATPYRLDGKGLGLAYDALVEVSSVRELIKEGHLVEPRVFTVPQADLPNLASIKLIGGDYNEKELDKAVNKHRLVGNIVEHWKKHAPGIRTVAFAASVEHSRNIAERFNAAGIKAEHLDGTTPKSERAGILERLDEGTTLVVANCGVLCEGWDQPSVKCAILARPTKSKGLYLQQAGRILRPFEGQGAIILDHAGCAMEHGLPQDEQIYTLESGKVILGDDLEMPAPRVKTCPDCCAVLPASTAECPECHHVFAAKKVFQESEGELVEFTSSYLDQQAAVYQELVQTAIRKDYKPGWVYHRFIEKFGVPPPRHFEQKWGFGLRNSEPADRGPTRRFCASNLDRVLRESARSRRSLSWAEISRAARS